MRRLPLLLVLLALAVRVLVAARTAIPDRDAAHYLWMAERMAAGDLGAPFRTVFHPLYPMLIGALLTVFRGLDGVVAGQVVACGLGALAVVPLVRLGDRVFGPPAGAVGGFLYAVGLWFARHPADCLSEGTFYLLVAAAALLLADGRAEDWRRRATAGVLAAAAYAARPEGAALVLVGVPWLWWRGERRSARAFVLGFAPVALLVPVGYAVFGSGLTLTPKAAFVLSVGIGAPGTDVVRHYLHELLGGFGGLFEALGYAAAPLVVAGVFLARPFRRADGPTLLAAVFALQLLVVPLLHSHIRFLSGYGILVLPFAGAAVARLWPRLRRWPRPVVATLALLAVTGDVVRLPAARRTERAVLREVGRFLGARLGPDQRIATEMHRLAYFAGQRPGPPRALSRRELLEACREPECRFAAIVEPRSDVHPADLEHLGFRPLDLPPRLRTLAARRAMLVYERR